MTNPLPDAGAVPIKYVGKKGEKHDTVNHTGTVWAVGQTIMYPLRLAKALLVHPDVWRIGKREDVADASSDGDKIIAASDSPPTDGNSGTARKPEELSPVSNLAREKNDATSVRGNRASLE